MSLSDIPKPLRILVRQRDGGRCGYCHVNQTGQASAFHIDHITPRSKDGATEIGNLTLQCPNCSLHKSNKAAATDPETAMTVALFHPLKDDWSQHFKMDLDGTIAGVTPTGRATVLALRMNDALPRTARAIQLLLGLIELL